MRCKQCFDFDGAHKMDCTRGWCVEKFSETAKDILERTVGSPTPEQIEDMACSLGAAYVLGRFESKTSLPVAA